MRGILLDLRYVARGLLKTPALFLVAVITIALGVGANTAMFSIVNAVVLKPLPFPQSESLVSLWPEKRWSQGMVRDVAERVQSYQGITSYGTGLLTLYGGPEPEPLDVSNVSFNHLDVLGVKPALGRGFQEGDAAAADGYVVILSHGLWQRRFGGDPTIIGRTLELSGVGTTSRTVVGVMPEGFTGMNSDAQLWIPIITAEGVPGASGTYGFSVLGRLRDGVSPPSASAELKRLVPEFTPLHPTQFRQARHSPVDVVPLLEQIVKDLRSKLFVLLGVVTVILLIACSNVANLLLARSTARQRDVALQMALGSSRGRVVRQVLTESAMLGLAGGFVGVLSAYVSLPIIRKYVEEQLPRTETISLDVTVLLFAVVISVLSGLIFGALPALRAVQHAPTSMLRESSRGQSQGRKAGRVNDMLVIAEVALTLVLLTGAGLMLKSLSKLSMVDTGFDAEHVLTMQIGLPAGKYGEAEQRAAFFQDALTRLQSLPGVQAAGSINNLPLTTASIAIPYSIQGVPVPEGESYQVVNWRIVTPEYFEALRIPLRLGRMLQPIEASDGEGALLVNEAFANQHWPGQDPLGHRLVGPSGTVLGTVVGVVGNVRQMEMAAAGVPEVYVHNSQSGWTPGFLLVRSTTGTPAQAMVMSALRDVEPQLTIRNVRTMDAVVHEALGDTRFFARLFAAFGALALALGMVGVYGVMAYAMTRKFRELGVRLALGATPVVLLRGVVTTAMIPVLVGVGIGAACALFAGRLLSNLLYEVSTTDPLVLTAMAVIMVLTGLFAALIPALKAIGMNPVSALRAE